MSLNTNGGGGCILSMHPTIELLQSIGYTYVAYEDLNREHASSSRIILTDHLAAAGGDRTLALRHPHHAQAATR